MSSIQLPVVDRNPLWSAAQAVGVVLTAVLVLGLLSTPDFSLHILWNIVIPILPAVFLLNPMIWRNVCPLATLNTIGSRNSTSKGLSTKLLVSAWTVGILLLVLMVPGRRFLFNLDGTVLAATIIVVGLLAVGAGALVSRRGGFCNALCPVLSVEKLYGQAPFVVVGSARCADCNLCTHAGCIDLAGKKSARQSVQQGKGLRWMLNPFGLFAGAFPGLVVGYFTTIDSSLSAAGGIYVHVLLWMGASLLFTTAVIGITRLRPTTALPLLGGASVGLYYWFAAPGIADAYHIGSIGQTSVRVLMLTLTAVWLRRALSNGPTTITKVHSPTIES